MTYERNFLPLVGSQLLEIAFDPQDPDYLQFALWVKHPINDSYSMPPGGGMLSIKSLDKLEEICHNTNYRVAAEPPMDSILASGSELSSSIDLASDDDVLSVSIIEDSNLLLLDFSGHSGTTQNIFLSTYQVRILLDWIRSWARKTATKEMTPCLN